MTDHSKFETLSQSDSLFPFPPHRRRHLRSDTFCTLVRIFSHFHGGESDHSRSKEVVSSLPKQGGGENELGQSPEPEVCNGTVGPTGIESETQLTHRDAQSLKEVGIDQCFHEDRMEIDESEHLKGIEKEHLENGYKCGNTLEDNQPCGSFVSLTGHQEGQCDLLETCMEESGKARQEEDNEDVFESLDLCLDIDILDEFENFDETNAEGNSFVERHVLEEVGHEMPHMDLEKSVSSCGAMNSPLCVTADGEIEEGEISGNFGLHDQSTDLLVGDAVSLEKKVDEEETSEAISNDEQAKAPKGANQEDTKCNNNFVETIVDACDRVDLPLKDSTMSAMEGNSETVDCGKIGDAKIAHGYDLELDSRGNKNHDSRPNEKFNHPLCYDDLYPTVPGKISVDDATESQGTLSTKKDTAVREKRKRGPLSEERKEKRKKKKRIKRAETNKRLGVKRLKIQPVLKPKTVSYCRHYLKGRCQEGENCKFSHDTIPLTKSKACCYFAHHSCLKGDDCPFDHQLSKYPCNNLLSKGSCSRGTGCMFSHEIQPREGSPITTTQLTSPSLLTSSNSEKQSNSHASSHQNVDSKSGSTAIKPPRKKTEQNVAESALKPAVQTPKGISKLMFGVSNQAGSFAKAGAGAKFGLPLIPNTPDIVQNSNGNRRMTESSESKGINFLSFGTAHLHDSGSKKPSSLSLSKDFGVQKSTFGDISKEKQAALPSQGDDGLKVGNQSQSARTPTVGPRGINFLSFGKAPLDESSNSKQATGPSNETNHVVVSSVQEGESASNGKANIVLSSAQWRESATKLQNPGAEPWRMQSSSSSFQKRESGSKLAIPIAKPWKMLSSSLQSDKSADRLVDNHDKETPSSSLKALFSTTPNSAQKGSITNTPNSAQKSLQSMLAFAAKYESRIKMDTATVCADSNKANSSSQSTSRGPTILDFLYSGDSKTKQ